MVAAAESLTTRIRIALRLDASQAGVRLLSELGRCNIAAARQQHAVEPGEDLPQRVLWRRRNQHRQAAGVEHGLDIGAANAG